MKIAFFISSMILGGAERTVAALANEFIKYNDEVYVFVIDDKPSFYELSPEIKYINLHKIVDSKNLFSAVQNNLKNVYKLRKLLKTVRPDAVLCFNITTLFTALLAKVFLKIKVIGTERSNPQTDRTNFFWRFAKRNFSVFSDGFIFQTQGAGLYYRKTVRKKSVIIPNAVFASDFPNRSLSVRKDICSVGRLEPVKGFDVLLKAFSLFSKAHNDYTLSIYGDGSEKDKLIELAKQLDLSDKVLFHGKVSDVPQKISESSMFVLSSRYEGMPNALMEAMACGLPSISTDCDYGPRELITHGENGLLIPVDDVDALAEAMKTIAEDAELARKLSVNAKNIRSTHSLNSISQRYHQYIESIVRMR